MSKYIKWKLFCDLVLCQVSRDKEDKVGRRGGENRRERGSTPRGCVRVETQEKNANQKRKRSNDRRERAQKNEVRGWRVRMLHRGTLSMINKGSV